MARIKIKKPVIITGITFLVFGAILGFSTLNQNTLESPIEEWKATLFILPEKGTFLINNNFSVRIILDTNEEINAAQATILFPTDKLEVVSLSKEKSILYFWITEPSYSNTDGTIQFIGGVPNPGFKGKGEIFTAVFKPKKEGKAQIKFKEGLVLANDGKGTNVLREQEDAFYSFISQSPLDLNDDGFINMKDFSILFWNLGVPENPKSDINKDGKVDIADLSILLFYSGQ